MTTRASLRLGVSSTTKGQCDTQEEVRNDTKTMSTDLIHSGTVCKTGFRKKLLWGGPRAERNTAILLLNDIRLRPNRVMGFTCSGVAYLLLIFRIAGKSTRFAALKAPP